MSDVERREPITVAQLKKLIANWPEKDRYGEPNTVWTETGPGLTSEVWAVVRLNENDILFELHDQHWSAT